MEKMVKFEKTKIGEEWYKYEDKKLTTVYEDGSEDVHILNEYGDMVHLIRSGGIEDLKFEYKYDKDGRIMDRIGSDGIELHYTRKEDGTVLTLELVDNKGSNIYEYKYDEQGNIILVKGDDGFEERREYNEQGKLTLLTNVDAGDGEEEMIVTYKHEYDASGTKELRMIYSSENISEVTEYEYDENGKLISSIGILKYLTNDSCYEENHYEFNEDGEIVHFVGYRCTKIEDEE